jgi:hypothetical protein
MKIVNILPPIPRKLTYRAGKIVIRFSQLERMLMQVLARESGATGKALINKVGEYKGKKFCELVQKLEKISEYDSFIKSLKEMGRARNGIHDILVSDFEGNYWIQSNNKKRPHRLINYDELVRLASDIEKIIKKLNNFSSARKIVAV